MKNEVLKSQSIFSSTKPESQYVTSSVAWHNVGHILPHTSQETITKIEHHYGPRGGAMDYSKPNLGLVVATADERIKHHAAYIEASLGKKFTVYEMRDLQNGTHPADTLIVPYINTTKTNEKITSLGQENWGIPHEMVTVLKNKVSFHEAVTASSIEGFEVPEYKIATVDTLSEKTKLVLAETELLYLRYQHVLPEKYPLGVMIRAEESDGNHGSALLKEDGDGTITVTPDGNTEMAIRFPKGQWDEAISFSTKTLEQTLDKDHNPQFVVSRYVKLAGSPGMSMIIKDGMTESLGWNDQLKQPNSTACIGTSTELSAEMEVIYQGYGDKTASDFASFLRETATNQHLNFDTIKGIVNVDLMFPASLEQALRKARGLDEDGYYVAECNARWTNFSDAALAVVGLTGREPSINGIKNVIQEGLHTIDRFDLNNASPENVRRELFAIDEEAKAYGDPHRTFMRMPDDPGGFIFTGDRTQGEHKIRQAIKRAKGTTLFLRSGY